MRRPDAAGTTLQVLEPLVQKLTEIEQRALRGEAIAVVDPGRALANILAVTGREAMELLLRQAAYAQGTHVLCTCGAKAESKWFERTSFVASQCRHREYQQAPRRPALQARRHDLERGRP